jgi:hypothetical protein
MKWLWQRTPGWNAHWLIALAVFLIYGRSLTIGFMGDDYDILTAVGQPHFDPWMTFPAGTGTYFRPLVLSLFYLEYQLAGSTAVWYHLTNLLLHVANGLLIFALCRRILGHRPLSLSLALLFVAHPLGLTAVTNINARLDSVMTLFYLASLWSFIRFSDTGHRRWLIVTGLALLASLLSKEMGVTLVGALWLWWHWRQPEATTYKTWGWLALSLYVLVTLLFVAYLYGRFYQSPAATPNFNLGYALSTFVVFPLLLLLPNRQSLLLQIYQAYPWLLWLGAAAFGLLLVGFLIWACRRCHRRELLLASGWIIISLLPLALSGINSRRAYLPLAMTCLALAIISGRLPSRWHQWRPMLLAITAVFALISFLQGQTWLGNWQIMQTACSSLPPLAPDAEPIFLTTPATANDAPIFANDLNGTLYFCQRQQFGSYTRLGATGHLILEKGSFVPGMVTLAHLQPSRYDLAIHIPHAYFDFPREAQLGQSYRGDLVTISVTAVRPDGRVTAFTAQFTQPDLLKTNDLFYFTGTAFQPVPAPK